MKPLYSVIFCNQNLEEHYEHIKLWLKEGIKVFWFGKREEVQKLKTDFPPYVSALFLQCYEVGIDERTVIYDGEGCEQIIGILEKVRPEFNAAQYLVEHCREDAHIIVEASAGTGKTTVMIDRIMFLLHTVPDLKPADIYMITFTNDATNQMNERLQQKLLLKYQLTGNIRYIKWLEEQSQMNISTIHSFAYMLFKEYSIESGFSQNLKLHTLNFERKELIKDGLNDFVAEGSSVRSQIGMSFYRGNSTLDRYWRKFAQLGFSKREIMSMNWGRGIDGASDKFQDAAIEVLGRLDDNYLELKQKNNAISLNDVIRDLEEVLEKADKSLSDLSIRYLFVDEFQDSDNSQIKVLCWLVKNIGIRLFVVGDIKQSIYRFRGANETAFSTLENGLKRIGADKPVIYSLVNNYRTSADVLQEMDTYFKSWANDGILDYRKPVKAFNKKQGSIRMYRQAGKYNFEEQFCNTAKRALEERNERLEAENRKPEEKDRVVVLCRTNRQLNDLSSICSHNHIPAVVKREGSFYISDAVRDFYAMISSFVFSEEPKYIFNYLTGPYSGLDRPLDMHALEDLNGDRETLRAYLDEYLRRTYWYEYYKEFRLRPVMAVIKKIIETEPVVTNYVSRLKRRQSDAGWTEEAGNRSAYARSAQYKANLEKLLEILQRNSAGEFSSLYDIYDFLKISIETNRDEQEAELIESGDINCLYCMTVHKAKGMEFDTVIVPFTETKFYYDGQTEVLVSNDNRFVGWQYRDVNTGTILQNTNYERIRTEEEMSATQEETRILYVAMTRTINTLICLVSSCKEENTWAHLIRKAGVIDEE